MPYRRQRKAAKQVMQNLGGLGVAQVCNIFAYYDEKMGAMSASVPVPRLHVHVRRLVEAGHKVTCSLCACYALAYVMCFVRACGKLIQGSGLAISVIWCDSSSFHRQL